MVVPDLAIDRTGLAYQLRFSVLPPCMVLRLCYEISGTDVAYVPTRYKIIRPFTMPPSSRISSTLYSVSAYTSAMQCPVLRASYHSVQYPYAILLRACYGKSGTDRAYHAANLLRNFPQHTIPVLTYGMMLCACYGISGTELGYGATQGGQRQYSPLAPR
eukprot:3940745-Rhodomonas_salina.19